MPTISVIVPAYNAEQTISETIQSVQQQTFTDFELIVINDGSTDKTLDILEQIQDPRLKIFTYANAGLPMARNRGIGIATGEFITFIDADDLWVPDKLELQLMAIQKSPEIGAAYSWTAFIDAAGRFLYAREPIFLEGDIYPHLLVKNFISNGSNILVRRRVVECAGRFEPTLKSAEDWDYYLRLASRCQFAVVPKYQILYRQSSQSMTSKVDVMEKYNLQVIERAFQSAPLELQYLKKCSLANTYRYIAQLYSTHALNSQSIKQASQRLQMAIRLNPDLLMERKTQRLALRLGLLQLLPYQLASDWVGFLGKHFPTAASQVLSEEGVSLSLRPAAN
ncbi:glycosyltransferase [Leptolyngbya sp. FACHB-261]|uniref:glycosyltransferase family 2 protein n=1 Tax=Leptolyngbya sp. FACHB-261 TaxID=2692806 RepID=UPI00168889FF|nr:glycosyltransferase [Leptolyngbya sp. FACHB-261]MBD2103241.1 glycosyltransferase [Leptolyngbya sp. FACHB-261]